MASIIKELPRLVADNIISTQTAADIEHYYAYKKDPENSLLLTVFGVLGSLLTGLGTILIFAHNWDDFSRPVKIVLAFFPLVLFQGLVGYVFFKNKNRAWKEAAGTLLFFAVGASIALVAQIYNIPGNTAAYLCTWVVLCLPLLYLLKSKALAILHLILSTGYAIEVGCWSSAAPYIYLLFMAAFAPFYYRIIKHAAETNGALIMHWLVPLSAIIAFGTFIKEAGLLIPALYMGFLCLLYSAGLSHFKHSKFNRTGYMYFSGTGILLLLFAGTFKWFWEEVSLDAPLAVFFVIWVFLLIANGYLLYIAKRSGRAANWLLWCGLAFPATYICLQFDIVVSVVIGNLIVLALGCITIKQGIDRLDFPSLNFGLLIIVMLIICRFFDTNMSFALRGLLFLTVGGGFFVANYIVARRKRTNPKNALPYEN